jgi:hypothetical protein
MDDHKLLSTFVVGSLLMVLYLREMNRRMDREMSQQAGSSETEKPNDAHREHSSLTFRYML